MLPSPLSRHFDKRYLAPVLVTMVLVVGQLSFGFLESWWRTAFAILTAIAIEMLLGRMIVGKWPHLASAYISGISIGMLLRSPEFWPYALCSAIAITSKYVLRVGDRHIWNPSNFAIVAMLVLAPDYVAGLSVQWGNYLLPMIVVWCFGSVIIYSLGRLHITATYAASFLGFALVWSLVTGHPFLSEAAPITGPMYQLYIFFMITDPKTTVHGKRAQCIVTVCVAAMEAALRLMQFVHAPYYALFIVGPIANLIEIAYTVPRRARPSRLRTRRHTDREGVLHGRKGRHRQPEVDLEEPGAPSPTRRRSRATSQDRGQSGQAVQKLANQKSIEANQKAILANQKLILAK
jgi:Na+-transporting NADH:ubiquinone oxidoreductase subunit NqrB